VPTNQNQEAVIRFSTPMPPSTFVRTSQQSDSLYKLKKEKNESSNHHHLSIKNEHHYFMLPYLNLHRLYCWFIEQIEYSRIYHQPIGLAKYVIVQCGNQNEKTKKKGASPNVHNNLQFFVGGRVIARHHSNER